MSTMPRREFIINGSAALAALALFQSRFAKAFPSRPGETVIAWLDQPTPNPNPEGIQTQLVWEEMNSWVTPNDKFFSISHFDRPIIDANTWKLEIDGLVKKPTSLTLADLKLGRARRLFSRWNVPATTAFPFSQEALETLHGPARRLQPFLKRQG
jgi:DMSO/TMAO reductase YedYZ molybdopterin-dependent catalytic subunit